MIAVEVKGRNPKFAGEVVGVYRAPNEDMRAIERLAARTGFTGNSTKHSIIGGDLNLPYAYWNGNAGGNSGTQAVVNSYSQVMYSPPRGDVLYGTFTWSDPKVQSPPAM